jgi:hypothetical protein
MRKPLFRHVGDRLVPALSFFSRSVRSGEIGYTSGHDALEKCNPAPGGEEKSGWMEASFSAIAQYDPMMHKRAIARNGSFVILWYSVMFYPVAQPLS